VSLTTALGLFDDARASNALDRLLECKTMVRIGGGG
jgi:hypothetical protein